MNSVITGPFSTAIATAQRVESTIPSAYRLAVKPDGTMVLQGCFSRWIGYSSGGHEWRDLPTVQWAEPDAASTTSTPDR